MGDGIAELSEQLTSAQNALSTSLIALRSGGSADPILISQGDAQLGLLLALKRQLSLASPATIAAIRADIVACISNASSVTQQAETATASGSNASYSIAIASQNARAAVASFEDDYYGKKKFEAYLHFSSPEDEEEFRRREAKRKEEIDKAYALNTLEGNAHALALVGEQLKDAGAHGANASPEYQSVMDQFARANSDLKAATDANPKSASNTRKSATVDPDPLDAIAAQAPIPSEEIAKLKFAGVTVAHQGEGHGITAALPRRETSQRIPT